MHSQALWTAASQQAGGRPAGAVSALLQTSALQVIRFCPCSIPRVDVDFGLCLPRDAAALPSPRREPFYYSPEEEIAYGPAAWLWDYLRRRCKPCIVVS